MDEHELALGLKAAGLDDSVRLAGRPRGRAHRARRWRPSARSEQRRRLAEAGQPRYELPMITDGIDLGGLYRLAAALREQGAA